MKVNIVHSQHSNNVMNDAEILNYFFKRLKEKPEVSHINVNNYTCPNARMNFFIETINYSFLRKARFNVFIPNQHYFNKEMVPMLEGIDYVICKTKYCYDIFKDLVPAEKLKYFGWRSSDISNHNMDKTREDWLVFYTDHNYQDVQKIIDIWQLDYPTLNILFSGVPRVGLKKRNLANIMYIEKMEAGKYEHLFNTCQIHVCLDQIDNFNHIVNQSMLCGAVPICINKGPVLEVLHEDDYFPISCNKKKINNYMGSKYTYSADDLEDAVKKALGTSETTLELMGANNKTWAHRQQTIFNQRAEETMRGIMKEAISVKKREDKKYSDDELPTLSFVTVYSSTPRFFKLPILNYRSVGYPREKLEWIVVNNTEDDIESLLPPVEAREQFRIRYTKCSPDATYGHMLNVGVENATNEAVFIMEDDYFFYEGGLRMIANEYLNGGSGVIGCTTMGTFDINRYTSIISTNGNTFDYFKRIYMGTVMFNRDVWNTHHFGEETGTEMSGLLNGSLKGYTEYSWEDKFVGLIYSKNETSKWIVPANHEPNGCHYKFSKKVYDFLVALDPKPEPEPEPEPTSETENSDIKTI